MSENMELSNFLFVQQLRSCQNGQLLNHIVFEHASGGSLPVCSAHSFDSLSLVESAEEGKNIHERMCWTR